MAAALAVFTYALVAVAGKLSAFDLEIRLLFGDYYLASASFCTCDLLQRER